MINIESCCSDPELIFRGERVNKKVVDFLSGIIKKNQKKRKVIIFRNVITFGVSMIMNIIMGIYLSLFLM